MLSFAELTKQVHSIRDLILSDMMYLDDSSEEAVNFSKHLLATKYWFARISYANKKLYLLALLNHVRSAWTLSLLLKSIWNCRLKDAVMSQSESGNRLSSYDQAPLDHNRTTLPVSTLAQAMKNDRIWFLSLAPESQALVLSELLTIAGGPAMWEVLRRARNLYERYQEHMIHNLQECVVINDANNVKVNATQAPPEKGAKKDQAPSVPAVSAETPQTQGRKNLEANLALWNATIKSMRDSLKIEEVEMSFLDGTKRKVWKVNRTKPDVMETLDFIQLLPSSVGKKILSFLPRAQLGDYSRVNRYWAYLVDEYRAEIAARIKINADFERLKEILLKHDETLEQYEEQNDTQLYGSEQALVNLQHLPKATQSVRASEKSGGAYSLRYFSDKLARPLVASTPIRNMTDFYERLEQRGAADENIWKWCENVISQTRALQKRQERKKKTVSRKKKGRQSLAKKTQLLQEQYNEGVLMLSNTHFPCPMMKTTLKIPLEAPLYKDPAKINDVPLKPVKKVSDAAITLPKGDQMKRYSLWTRDVSSLYPVFKIPSYQFPPV